MAQGSSVFSFFACLLPFERGGDAVFEHEVGRVVFEPEEVCRRAFERGLRDEADDLARDDADAEALGLAPHGLERLMDVRALVTRQVHRDLNDAAALKLEAERLQVWQPAVALANRTGDSLRDRDVARVERDVVSNQKGTHADDASARGRMNAPLANVGRTLRVRADLPAQKLEPAAAHVGQILSLRPRLRAVL